MMTLTGIETIQSLDLEAVKKDLAQKLKWSPRRIEKAVEEYKYFLEQCLLSPSFKGNPTKDADEVWHFHILHTMKYAEDCTAIFGRFLHHFPSLDLDIVPPGYDPAMAANRETIIYATCGSGGNQGT